MAVEDLDVYRKLCELHLEVCDLTHQWPAEERYELGSQARRSSNSSPSQLAEKNDDRHGLEKTLEKKLPVADRRWQVAEDHPPYGSESELCPPGWPPET
jgi:hypothetical protein